ncbi:hypothetical protein, partial [Pseudomonas sp. URMO17WK12:I11]|uniref:hypothetical protein n=1 Tax=Pseudomonas sp. URMO17WK12:I11 TaxID=1283291 RepID=UPI001C498796
KVIQRRHRKWTMLSIDTHTNPIKLQNSKFKIQNSNFKLQTSNFKLQTSNFKLKTSNFKLQSVGAYIELVFIGAGGA